MELFETQVELVEQGDNSANSAAGGTGHGNYNFINLMTVEIIGQCFWCTLHGHTVNRGAPFAAIIVKKGRGNHAAATAHQQIAGEGSANISGSDNGSVLFIACSRVHVEIAFPEQAEGQPETTKEEEGNQQIGHDDGAGWGVGHTGSKPHAQGERGGNGTDPEQLAQVMEPKVTQQAAELAKSKKQDSLVPTRPMKVKLA